MAGGYTEGPSEDKKDPIRVTAVKIERKTSINNVSKMLSHRIFDWWDIKCKEKEEIRHDSDVSCLGNRWKSRSNKIGKLEE